MTVSLEYIISDLVVMIPLFDEVLIVKGELSVVLFVCHTIPSWKRKVPGFPSLMKITCFAHHLLSLILYVIELPMWIGGLYRNQSPLSLCTKSTVQ